MSDPQQPPYALQPENAQSPYGLQPGGYPAASGYPAAPGYSQPASTLGRTAFILAVISAALGLIFSLAIPLMMPGMRGGYAIYELITAGRSILGLILGALTLTLGIVAARRGSQPVLAGIAIGVGAVELLGLLASFFVTLIYTVI